MGWMKADRGGRAIWRSILRISLRSTMEAISSSSSSWSPPEESSPSPPSIGSNNGERNVEDGCSENAIDCLSRYV